MKTSAERIAALEAMLARNPDDPRARFGLAAEFEKLEQWDAAITHLQAYLRTADDEGNAYARLGRAFAALGRVDEARSAYAEGIAAANRHGHPSLAEELEALLEGE